MKNGLVELQADSIWYYSEFDEDFFFKWLERIPCFEKCEGIGTILYIDIVEEKLDQDCLRELLALFYRYNVDMTQLKQFDRKKWSKWFRGKEAYWHERVFSEPKKLKDD